MSDTEDLPYADEATIAKGEHVEVLAAGGGVPDYLVGRIGDTVGAIDLRGQVKLASGEDPFIYAVAFVGEDSVWFFLYHQLQVTNFHYNVEESNTDYAVRVCGVDPPGFEEYPYIAVPACPECGGPVLEPYGSRVGGCVVCGWEPDTEEG